MWRRERSLRKSIAMTCKPKLSRRKPKPRARTVANPAAARAPGRGTRGGSAEHGGRPVRSGSSQGTLRSHRKSLPKRCRGPRFIRANQTRLRSRAGRLSDYRATQDLIDADALPEEKAKADADVAAAEKNVRVDMEKLQKCDVRAPFSGTVLKIMARVGRGLQHAVAAAAV